MLHYDSSIKLQQIKTEEVTADAEADGKGTADDQDNGGASSSIADASALMKVA